LQRPVWKRLLRKPEGVMNCVSRGRFIGSKGYLWRSGLKRISQSKSLKMIEFEDEPAENADMLLLRVDNKTGRILELLNLT